MPNPSETTIEAVPALTILGVECPHIEDKFGQRRWRGRLGVGAVILVNQDGARYQLTIHVGGYPSKYPSSCVACAFGDDAAAAAVDLAAQVRNTRAALASLDCGDDLAASGLLGVGAR